MTIAPHPTHTTQRAIWTSKPALRTIYTDYYRRIVSACRTGRTIEIGGGSGNLKQFWPDTISTDLVPAPWLDVAADAQALPFADNCIENIVGVDVLHHIAHPRRFFTEAARVLRPGGRIALIEPAITPGSYIFYKYLHPEPVRYVADPLAGAAGSRDPFDSNQAIPTLLFGRAHAAFRQAFPTLALIERRYISLLAYPLSGGFRRWSLVPGTLTSPILALERVIEGVLGPLLAFRLMVVLEKRG